MKTMKNQCANVIKLTACACTLYFCLLPTLAFSDEEIRELTPEEKVQAGKTMERWVRGQHGRFLLSGVVVDESGQPLSKVHIDMEKRRIPSLMAAFSGEHQEDRETRIVDGAFRIDLTNYFAVDLMFGREGYYQKKFHFGMPEPGRAGGEDIIAGKEVRQLLVREGLRIVLEKIGKLTHLADYGALLEYRATGAGKVLNFDISWDDYPARDVANVHDSQQLPTNCVYIIADTEPDGIVSAIQRRPPTAGSAVPPENYPRRVRLIMHAEGGGFIKFTPQDKQRMYHQMKAAPETGYQKELIVDEQFYAEEAAKKPGEDRGLFFFFKSKDKFGKGSIEVEWLDRTKLVARVGCSFRVQSDGSRNLETEELIPYSSADTGETGGGGGGSPTITLLGDNPAATECGNPYIEGAAKASNDAVISVLDEVNTSTLGTYTVTYKISDTNDNLIATTRTVTVIDTARCLSPLLGDNPLEIQCSFPFDDPGARARRSCRPDRF